jgi:hypothetical protein
MFNKKRNTLQNKKKTDNFVSKCVLSGNVPHIVSFIVTVILIIIGIILYNKFLVVKVQLESCRSSIHNQD